MFNRKLALVLLAALMMILTQSLAEIAPIDADPLLDGESIFRSAHGLVGDDEFLLFEVVGLGPEENNNDDKSKFYFETELVLYAWKYSDDSQPDNSKIKYVVCSERLPIEDGTDKGMYRTSTIEVSGKIAELTNPGYAYTVSGADIRRLLRKIKHDFYRHKQKDPAQYADHLALKIIMRTGRQKTEKDIPFGQIRGKRTLHSIEDTQTHAEAELVLSIPPRFDPASSEPVTLGPGSNCNQIFCFCGPFAREFEPDDLLLFEIETVMTATKEHPVPDFFMEAVLKSGYTGQEEPLRINGIKNRTREFINDRIARSPKIDFEDYMEVRVGEVFAIPAFELELASAAINGNRTSQTPFYLVLSLIDGDKDPITGLGNNDKYLELEIPLSTFPIHRTTLGSFNTDTWTALEVVVSVPTQSCPLVVETPTASRSVES